MNLKKAIGGALLAGTVAVTGLIGGTAATAFATAAAPNTATTPSTTAGIQPVSNAISQRAPLPQGYWKWYRVVGPDGKEYWVRRYRP